MRPDAKVDNAECHVCVLMCTDDALVISENAEKFLKKEIGKHFELKPESAGLPSMHLRGSSRKVLLENGECECAFSSSRYVQSTEKSVEEYLAKGSKRLDGEATPAKSSHRLEIDASN